MSGDAASFSWPVRVYYEDTDAQGVVYYANYLNYMERARTEWIRALGIEQDELLSESRRLFVVTELCARFVKPARFNDELLVTARTLERARASFVIGQQVLRASELLVSAEVRAACIDADSNKPVRLPELLLRELPS